MVKLSSGKTRSLIKLLNSSDRIAVLVNNEENSVSLKKLGYNGWYLITDISKLSKALKQIEEIHPDTKIDVGLDLIINVQDLNTIIENIKNFNIDTLYITRNVDRKNEF